MRALTEVTPYEAWLGRKPDVSHLRVFGYVAYMKMHGVHTSKLDDRSKKTIYLGREPGTKACRLYDPVFEKILVSRDVVFEEQKAWEWDSQPLTDYISTGIADLPKSVPLTVVGHDFTHTEIQEPEVEPVTPQVQQ
ncbi:hypothetical protein AgCh_018736 [Apium graveolens]